MSVLQLHRVTGLLLICTGLHAGWTVADDRIPVEPTPWRTSNDIIDGWDWSLPPGIAPVPFSGTNMPWPLKNGKRYDLPGNEIVAVRATWRELEPVEGQYRFDILRGRIQEAAKGWDGVELHVYGSVWEIRNFPDIPHAKYPPNWLEREKQRNISAPSWFEHYQLDKIHGRPRYNLTTPFQVISLDIFDTVYHNRYLRFLKALGDSGIPRMEEIICCYLHEVSGSRGEEGPEQELQIDERKLQCLAERLKGWADIFPGMEFKLASMGNRGPNVHYAYELGMGQRSGFVDMVMQDINNPLVGQRVDPDGYATVDEQLSPIRDNRVFGDENEEFMPVGIPRFGPWETFAHRYRESMLRVLQMRRNFLWIDPNMMNPPLTAYVSLELGRQVQNTPDIWCYLRESIVAQEGQPLTVKNFERWLYQRDQENYRTEPTAQVMLADSMKFYHRKHRYDFTARRTDTQTGNKAIGFAVDDRFLSGGPHRVAVKITYHDQGPARWALSYNKGAGQRDLTCWSYGDIRTATFFLEDAHFDAKGLDYDFEIRALESDAVIKFVRVIKLE